MQPKRQRSGMRSNASTARKWPRRGRARRSNCSRGCRTRPTSRSAATAPMKRTAIARCRANCCRSRAPVSSTDRIHHGKKPEAMSTPDLATLKQMFRRAPFVAELGMELESLGEGECVTVLRVEPRHLQQNGVVHAGVQATMADHTAGAAASTVAPPGGAVMTAEFKISLLRAARGELLRCRARVLKPGRQLMF